MEIAQEENLREKWNALLTLPMPAKGRAAEEANVAWYIEQGIPQWLEHCIQVIDNSRSLSNKPAGQPQITEITDYLADYTKLREAISHIRQGTKREGDDHWFDHAENIFNGFLSIVERTYLPLMNGEPSTEYAAIRSEFSAFHRKFAQQFGSKFPELPTDGDEEKTLADRVNAFLSRKVAQFADTTESQEYLIRFIANFVHQYREPIDAISQVKAQTMLNDMGAFFRALKSIQRGDGEDAANLQILQDKFPVFDVAHKTISQLQLEDQTLADDLPGIISGIKKTQKHLREDFSNLLQSPEPPQRIITLDGKTLEPGWAKLVGPQETEPGWAKLVGPQAASFAALAASYRNEHVPGLTCNEKPYGALAFLREDLTAALAASYSKISTWEAEGTLPSDMPNNEQVRALGTELQQFFTALEDAARGNANQINRIFIGNLPHILENSQLVIGSVLEESFKRQEADMQRYESLPAVLGPIQKHFQQHFGKFLCDEGIAASRA